MLENLSLNSSKNPLFAECVRGRTSVIKKWCTFGLDRYLYESSVKVLNGKPLEIAIISGQKELFMLLVDSHICDINFCGTEGPPLLLCTLFDDVGMIDMIINHPQIDLMVVYQERTVLINILSSTLPLYLKQSLIKKIVQKLLLRFGSDPPPEFFEFLNYASTSNPPMAPISNLSNFKYDFSSVQGWTALHLACLIGAVDTVRLLLDAGASLNVRLSNHNNYSLNGGNPFMFSRISMHENYNRNSYNRVTFQGTDNSLEEEGVDQQSSNSVEENNQYNSSSAELMEKKNLNSKNINGEIILDADQVDNFTLFSDDAKLSIISKKTASQVLNERETIIENDETKEFLLINSLQSSKQTNVEAPLQQIPSVAVEEVSWGSGAGMKLVELNSSFQSLNVDNINALNNNYTPDIQDSVLQSHNDDVGNHVASIARALPNGNDSTSNTKDMLNHSITSNSSIRNRKSLNSSQTSSKRENNPLSHKPVPPPRPSSNPSSKRNASNSRHSSAINTPASTSQYSSQFVSSKSLQSNNNNINNNNIDLNSVLSETKLSKNRQENDYSKLSLDNELMISTEMNKNKPEATKESMNGDDTAQIIVPTNNPPTAAYSSVNGPIVNPRVRFQKGVKSAIAQSNNFLKGEEFKDNSKFVEALMGMEVLANPNNSGSILNTNMENSGGNLLYASSSVAAGAGRQNSKSRASTIYSGSQFNIESSDSFSNSYGGLSCPGSRLSFVEMLPIHVACLNGKWDILEILLSYIECISNPVTPISSVTAVMCAAIAVDEDAKCLEILLKRLQQESISVKTLESQVDLGGNSALHWAAWFQRLPQIRVFVKNGWTLYAKNKKKMTPIDLVLTVPYLITLPLENTLSQNAQACLFELRRCASCGSTGANLVCYRCQNVKYCSSECQKAHWNTHKKHCQ